MDETELDGFLRKHSYLEDHYLKASQQNAAKRLPAPEILIFDPNTLDSDTLKKHYFLVDHLPAAIRSQPTNVPLYRESFINLEFAFSCHCRFSETSSHQHDYIEMQYVYSGTCRQTINGETFTLNQGEFCLLDTNVTHSIEASDEGDIIVNLLMSKHYLDNNLLPRLSGHSLIASFCAQAIHQSSEHQRYVVFKSGTKGKIHQLMVGALCEYFDKSEYAAEIVDSYLVLVFSELMKIVMRDTDHVHQAELSNNNISDILKFISAHCLDTSLKATAQEFRLSPTYLSATIKKLTGRNFRDILQDARLKRAAYLLKTTSLPTSQIAEDVGYQNVSFFYRLFQKTYHLTPLAYRKAQGK